ncbi:MAG: hypothetical protein ACLFPL_00595 [Candidatus Nanoarchaeia archaeon]
MKICLSSILLVIIMTLGLNSSFSSGTGLFSCEFIDRPDFSTCSGPSSDIAFYSNGDFTPDSEFINAVMSTESETPSGAEYQQALCCTAESEVEIDFEYRYDGNRCEESGNQFEFGFFNSLHNSKLSLNYSEDYNNSICLNVDNEEFASLDVKLVDESSSNLGLAGYNCMYRFGSGYHSTPSDVMNAKLSTCDAQYSPSLGSTQKYPFLVYARLTPNIDSSTCNADCTSTVDNRIYSGCGATIQACQSTPVQCDGSLKGQWVPYDDTREILCEQPFDKFRETSRTTQEIEVRSGDNTCRDIIKQEYDVLVDSETITMSVYICND